MLFDFREYSTPGDRRMHHDQHGGRLHLRIVYAGAPLSGKTETLKALVPSLHGQAPGHQLFSPQEARGRTLYFDWAEWQGGLFRSGTLNCQITSVPGQDALQERRRLLVRAADAMVFVIDARRDQMTANRRSLEEVRTWLERDGAPPIPVVYQCNKRDLPDSLDAAAIRAALGLGDAEVHESSAIRGEGVRICFVAAVGACIRRAETLIGLKQMPPGLPQVETSAQLLEMMRTAEDGRSLQIDEEVTEPVAAPSPLPAAAARTRPAVMPMADWLAQADAAPERPPTRARATGRPAVMPMADWLATQAPSAAEGAAGDAATPDRRNAMASGDAAAQAAPAAALLEPAARTPEVTAPRVPWLDGAAAAIVSAWPPDVWAVVLQGAAPGLAAPLAHAPAALQADLGHARFARTWGAHAAKGDAEREFRRLVDWTAAQGDALSSPRCVVLTGRDGHGFYAWQVVQRASTLDRLVARAFEPALPAKDVAHLLAFAANAYLTSADGLARRVPLLPIHLRTLARQERRTVYAEFLPREPAAAPPEPALTRLEHELRAHLTAERLLGLDVPDVLRELEALAEGRPSLTETVELLQSLLIGH
jgi:signal recognition particle receptor subunit beta